MEKIGGKNRKPYRYESVTRALRERYESVTRVFGVFAFLENLCFFVPASHFDLFHSGLISGEKRVVTSILASAMVVDDQCRDRSQDISSNIYSFVVDNTWAITFH